MGSCTHIVDDSKILNQYEYDAWGNVTSQKETVKKRFKFNGQQLDPITQQYHLRARFYNPVIARFPQEDTYRGDGLNLYTYCANNPVYYVDHSGHMCDPPSDVLKRALKEGERFDDLSDEQKELIAEYYRERGPIISIPEGVKGKAQSKTCYKQISYKCKDGEYKYEARWHTRTPDTPENQGRTWVIERVKPGNGGVKPSRHFLIGEDEWVEGYKWFKAIQEREET